MRDGVFERMVGRTNMHPVQGLERLEERLASPHGIFRQPQTIIHSMIRDGAPTAPSWDLDRAFAGMEKRLPTSDVLEGLLETAPADTVTLAWIVDRLRDRSFGIVVLLIAVVALVPGISPLAGVLLAVIAAQMILGRPAPALPGFVASRSLSTARLTRLVGRIAPILRWIERFLRPRWHTPFEATKRAIGGVTLLLSATLLAPIPFSHLIPATVTMLLAFAFLEEDGILLAIALGAAVVSLLITVAAAWGTIEASLAL